MFLAMNSESIFALFIAIGCFFVPIVILMLVVVGKMIYKSAKRSKQVQEGAEPTPKYLSYFGGDDNIVNISKDMTRVTVEVRDLERVELEQLRMLGIGILITGNTIKCSSKEFAAQIRDM